MYLFGSWVYSLNTNLFPPILPNPKNYFIPFSKVAFDFTFLVNVGTTFVIEGNYSLLELLPLLGTITGINMDIILARFLSPLFQATTSDGINHVVYLLDLSLIDYKPILESLKNLYKLEETTLEQLLQSNDGILQCSGKVFARRLQVLNQTILFPSFYLHCPVHGSLVLVPLR